MNRHPSRIAKRLPSGAALRGAGPLRLLCIAAAASAWSAWTVPARAGVSEVVVTERSLVADGARFGKAGRYEKIRGVATIRLDPDAPANKGIVDLEKAPRDESGFVLFKTDFLMLRPEDPARRRSSILYEVNNRGFITMLGQMQEQDPARNDPTSLADMGNGFLLNQGFTLLWSAWTWDTEAPTPDNRLFRLDLPVARGSSGRSLTGKVAYETLVDRASPTARFTGLFSRAYPQAEGAAAGATLTVRTSAQGKRRPIPRGRWRFVAPTGGEAPDTIALDGGFQPGRLYELIYTARDPVVVGAGLAGIRDLLSWFKANAFEGAPPFRHSLVFGISQSGRVITTMITLGLNVDEDGKPAIDGAYVQVAGGGKGSFNHRFGMPTRNTGPLVDEGYPTDYFPFATTSTRDPETGREGSVLDGARKAGHVPRIIIANSSAEYWNRSASLLTTTPDGAADVPVDPSVRVYMLAGAQHYVGKDRQRFPRTQCVNTADHYPVERALILALDAWVEGSAPPPESRYPRIGDGTLTDMAAFRRSFPLRSLPLPAGPLRPPRLDLGPRFAGEGIVDHVPPIPGKAFGTLIPAVDADGNDRSGVRLVELAVPLGTHSGWNTRMPEAGFPDIQARYDGAFIPFARTRAERAPGDERLPIDERYAGKAAFETRVREAATAQAKAGFLLPGEIEAIVARRSRLYDRIMARDPKDGSCDYLFDPEPAP